MPWEAKVKRILYWLIVSLLGFIFADALFAPVIMIGILVFKLAGASFSWWYILTPIVAGLGAGFLVSFIFLILIVVVRQLDNNIIKKLKQDFSINTAWFLRDIKRVHRALHQYRDIDLLKNFYYSVLKHYWVREEILDVMDTNEISENLLKVCLTNSDLLHRLNINNDIIYETWKEISEKKHTGVDPRVLDMMLSYGWRLFK